MHISLHVSAISLCMFLYLSLAPSYTRYLSSYYIRTRPPDPEVKVCVDTIQIQPGRKVCVDTIKTFGGVGWKNRAGGVQRHENCSVHPPGPPPPPSPDPLAPAAHPLLLPTPCLHWQLLVLAKRILISQDKNLLGKKSRLLRKYAIV